MRVTTCPAQTFRSRYDGSGGLAHGRHVEVGHSDGRHDRPVEVVVPLPAQGQLGGANLGDPAQQLDRRIIEAEIVDGTDHLPVLDQIDPVASEPSQQQPSRVDLADIPQAGQQQTTFGRGDHLLQVGRATTVHDQVVGRGRRLGASTPGMGPVADQLAQHPILNPGRRVDRQANVERPGRVVGGGREVDKRDRLQTWMLRIRQQGDRQLSKPVPDLGRAVPAGEHVATLFSVAGIGCPVRVDHQVRDGTGRQQRLVAPRRQIQLRRRPVQPGGQLVNCLGNINVGEVPGRPAQPC